MSEAGVRSSIGDDYQDMLAVWWLAKMLTDETLRSIDVESTSLINCERVRVDDVIIHKNDSIICCQCKVDHPRRETWNVTDLKDDLCKAWKHWQSIPESEIYFYSTGPFGGLKHLQERAERMPDVDAFIQDMPQNSGGEYSKFLQIVAQRIASPDEIYTFFRQLKFKVKSYDDLSSETITHLSYYVTQPHVALTLLNDEVRRVTCRRQDPRAAHVSNYSIDRHRLLYLLNSAGLRITPRLSETQITTYFAQFSNRGRVWQRKIKEHHFLRTQQQKLIAHINSKQSVLIDGSPGSGKTCILLDLVDYFENNPHYFCIFLQTRDIEDSDIDEFRAKFLNSLARMAENLLVVLVVDSLDVLSTSGRHRFTAVITLMEQARKIPNACVVASCRTFDLQYDRQLSALSWPQKLHLDELDFDTDVTQLLLAHGVDSQLLSAEQKKLICNPRMLKMFLDISEKDVIPTPSTVYSLSEIYLDKIIMQNELLGSSALETLRAISARMISEKRLSIPKRLVSIDDKQRKILLSEGVLLETSVGNYAFSHQTLVDVLAVEHAQAQGQTLSIFMASMPAVPFIRPTIRYFFFSLYNQDIVLFRKQLRSALADNDQAFHIKKLLATSLAETSPDADDVSLLHSMFECDETLFFAFFEKSHPKFWFDFFQQHLLPVWQRTQNWPWLHRYIQWLRRGPKATSSAFVALLSWLLANATQDNIDNTAITIISSLDSFDDWGHPGLQKIFTLLMRNSSYSQFDLIGKPLSKWVNAIDSHDGMLWNFISHNKDNTNQRVGNIILNCEEHIFCEEDFLEKRLQKSEDLLTMALSALDEWSEKTGSVLADGVTRNNFLLETSHGHRRSRTGKHNYNSLEILLNAVERACIKHAEQNSNWWRTWAQCLWSNAECALRYMALCGLTQNPQSNLPLVEHILLHLTDSSACIHFDYELPCLLGAASAHLSIDVLQKIQNKILLLHEDRLEQKETNIHFVWRIRQDYLIEIPAPYRIPESIAAIKTADRLCGIPLRAPSIETRGGFVRSPVSHEQLINFSSSGLLKILQYYGSKKFEDDWGWSDVENDHIIGGSRLVAQELTNAASVDPERFYQWSRNHWDDITPEFQAALLRGIAEYVRIQFGNSHRDNWTAKSTPSEETLFDYLLQFINTVNWTGFDGFCLQSVLCGCAWLVRSLDDLGKLYPLLCWCSNSSDPAAENCENLQSIGLNSLRGVAAESAFVIASHWLERGQGNLPDLLLPILHQLAEDPHPAVRGRVLQGLPTVLHYSQDIGWQLFQKAVAHGPSVIWESAYMCLYYNYRKHYGMVKGYLDVMNDMAMPNAAKPWGKILALAYLSDKIDKNTFIDNLVKVNLDDAWKAAVDVLGHNTDKHDIENKCFEGLGCILEWAPKHEEIFRSLCSIFRKRDDTFCFPPESFLEQIFAVSAKLSTQNRSRFYQFPKWMLALSERDCDAALRACELFLEHCTTYMPTDDSQSLVKLLTVLFREAEEREELDNGEMLRRVLDLQDTMLRKGISAMDDWLEEAERP